jgi:hypothetical protein
MRATVEDLDGRRFGPDCDRGGDLIVVGRTGTMTNFRTALVLALVVAVGCAAATRRGAQPEAGFVPDQDTAVRIAEAVWIPIYGEKNILDQRPHRAILDGDVWKVTGTLHCASGSLCVGGSAYAEISRNDGRVLYVVHYQ